MKTGIALVVMWFAAVCVGQTTKPVKPFEQPHQIMNTIPARERPQRASDWTTATLKFVQDSLTEETAGKPLGVTAQFVSYDANGNTATFESKGFKWGGVTLDMRYVVKWGESKAGEFRKVKPGARVKLAATIGEYEVSADDETVTIQKRHIDGPPTEEQVQEPHVKVTVKATPAPDMLAENKR